MEDLVNGFSSNNLVIVCIIMSFIALFLAIAIAIEVFNTRRRKGIKIDLTEPEEEPKLNIKEDQNITYVEEDEEFEKTKAKLELEKLKEELQKQEEKEKKEALKKKEEVILPVDTKEINKVETTPVKEEVVKENNVVLDTVKEEKVIENVNNNVVSNDNFEEEKDFDDEEDAIISYDELKKATNFGYTDEEMEKYMDEKDAIISIDELERLYKESAEIKPAPPIEIKRVEDLPEISDAKKFQRSPLISPVYGVGIKEREHERPNDNFEKLSEEIRKTNEFLKALRELKKNLQ